MNKLIPTLLLLISFPLAVLSTPIDDLFDKPRKGSVRTLTRIVKKLPETERNQYLAAALELQSHYAEIATHFEPWITRNKTIKENQAAVAAVIACAQLKIGKIDPAKSTLILLRNLSKASALSKAEWASVECLLAVQNKEWVRAEILLKTTHLKVESEYGEKGGKPWRQRLIEFRMKGVLSAIKRGRAIEAGGEIYADWLQADKTKTIVAYRNFSKKHPDTLLADAAALEEVIILLNAMKADEAIRLIKKAKLETSRLAAAAALLKGDSFALKGRLKEAAAAYDSVISILRDPSPAEDVLEPLRSLLAAKQALHDHGSGWPVWRKRTRGTILDPGLSPFVTVYLRHDAVIKRSALAAESGNLELAVQLANSLRLFDPVDRIRAERKQGAGSRCLAYAWKDEPWKEGKSLVPMDSFKGASKALRAQLFIAVAYYQTYDWQRCLFWSERALKNRKFRGLPKDAAHSLAGCAADMLDDENKMGYHSAAVKFRRGQKPSQAWWIARCNEDKLSGDTKPNKEWIADRMRIMQEVRKLAPGTEYERDALIRMILSSDVAEAERLFAEYIKIFPNDIFIKAIKTQILNRKNAQ